MHQLMIKLSKMFTTIATIYALLYRLLEWLRNITISKRLRIK